MRPLLTLLLLAGVAGLFLAGCGAKRDAPVITRIEAPPPGKVLVNFHFDHPRNNADWSLHNGKREIVFFFQPRSLHQVVVEPGQHDFFAMEKMFGAAYMNSHIRIHAVANKVYDVHIRGEGAGSIGLNPLKPTDSKYQQIIARSRELQAVGPVDRSSPDNRAREEKMAGRIDREYELMSRDPQMTLRHELFAQDCRP